MRLQDFIKSYYLHTGSQQAIDDDYCAFVWSVVVQQPSVIVGVVPDGVQTEVFIAPQPSQKRKAKERGEDEQPVLATQLEIIVDAQARPLRELRDTHGNRLRIATDAETTFSAVTGSHIRVRKNSASIIQTLTRTGSPQSSLRWSTRFCS